MLKRKRRVGWAVRSWRAWRRPTLPCLETEYHWRLRLLTAEFGMGSGVWPLAMATRPAIAFPGGPPAGAGCSGGCHVRRKKKCLWAVGAPVCCFGRDKSHGGVLPRSPLLRGQVCGAEGFAAMRGGLDRAPIERLVPVSSTDCSAFTSGLSTWWSSTALGETWF